MMILKNCFPYCLKCRTEPVKTSSNLNNVQINITNNQVIPYDIKSNILCTNHYTMISNVDTENKKVLDFYAHKLNNKTLKRLDEYAKNYIKKNNDKKLILMLKN